MRPRYPGVEDEFRRATFLGETHPYPSWLRYCGSKVESSSTSAHRRLTRGDAPGGAGPRGVLIWRQQGYPVGPTGTSRMA